jgi:glycosyltransferase involved in cell wall biosynthesis
VNHLAIVLPGIDRIAGAERQAILLAQGMAHRGWRVSFIALTGTGGDAARELQSAGIPFTSFGMRKGLADPRGWLRLHRWLGRHSPDIVQAHLPHAAWMTRVSRLFAPSRVVLDTIHTSHTGTAARRWSYRLTSPFSDRVTTVSQGVAEAYLSARMVSPNRLIVVPNGIDTQAWQPDPNARATLRADLGLTTEFLWLAAGRLEPVKDYPTLLRALAELPASNRLIIAGSGRLESDLRLLSRQLGIDSRVHFAGFQSDIRPWMQAADAFVLSSLWEGLPMCLLEAAACAVATVAPDIPGVREILTDGQNGFSFAAGNPASLRDSMIRMTRLDTNEHSAMGLAARQKILADFSLSAVLDRWQALYVHLLKTRPLPRHTASRP